MSRDSVATVVDVAKAAAEPTRLRILASLRQIELTVSELCRVLSQSQPRVSRHLKLLVEAGLLERHSEGASAFYRLSPVGSLPGLVPLLVDAVDRHDPVLVRDRERLDMVRAERAAEARAYFETVAGEWELIRSCHVSDASVEAALLDAVQGLRVVDLVDIGTGTGRVLEVFADRIETGIGLDLSREMLAVARSRLDGLGLANCTVRQSDAYNLELSDGTADVAVLHHVLHFLDQPADAIAEAARVLRPNGRLLVVDFAPHQVEALRAEHAHRRLGFAQDEVAGWCRQVGLDVVDTRDFAPRELAADSAALTVTLWIAERPTNSASNANVASRTPEAVPPGPADTAREVA